MPLSRIERDADRSQPDEHPGGYEHIWVGHRCLEHERRQEQTREGHENREQGHLVGKAERPAPHEGKQTRLAENAEADELPADPDAALAQLLADPLAVDDAIAALRRYSLISPPNGGLVSVHRLVQAITVARLPASQAAAWQQATAALITAALPADPQLPAGWPVFAALLSHVLAAPQRHLRSGRGLRI